jgi:hypothetical protein
MRFQGCQMWLAAVLASAAAGLVSGCANQGPQSVGTTCITGEVVSSGEPGGPLGNFFSFPGPFRAARSGSGDRAASAFEFTVTNDSGGDVQVTGYSVVTYSAGGTAIGTFTPGPGQSRLLIGRDLFPGRSYTSDPVPDPPITAASGRFEESDTCKVFVNWFNPDGDQF